MWGTWEGSGLEIEIQVSLIFKAMKLGELSEGMRKGPRTELTAPLLRGQGHKEKSVKETEQLPKEYDVLKT